MAQRTTTSLIGALLILSFLSSLGCAPGYNSYSGCRVPCKYCAPPPLPYAHYPGCDCHSCAAESHLANPQATADSTSPPSDIPASPLPVIAD